MSCLTKVKKELTPTDIIKMQHDATMAAKGLPTCWAIHRKKWMVFSTMYTHPFYNASCSQRKCWSGAGLLWQWLQPPITHISTSVSAFCTKNSIGRSCNHFTHYCGQYGAPEPQFGPVRVPFNAMAAIQPWQNLLANIPNFSHRDTNPTKFLH